MTTTVPPYGSKEIPLIFVGEAPGAQEARQGRPFVGPSGQVLRQIASKIGLDIDRCYVTNAVKVFYGSPTTPTDAELLQAHRGLVEEIRQVAESMSQDPVVIPLGNSAVKALLGRKNVKITQLRGIPVKHEALGLWVLPTFHPAAILRGTQKPGDMLADLVKAVRIAKEGTAENLAPQVKWKIVKSVADFENIVDRMLSREEVVAVDIETDGYHWTTDKILMVGFYDGDEFAYIVPERLLDHSGIKKQFARLASGKRWVGHNFKFDLHFLREAGLPAVHHEDTMLIHYVLDERRGTHGLKQLATELLSAPDYEADIKQYLDNPRTDSYRNIPQGVLARYLAHDVVYTWHIHKLLTRRLDATGRRLHDKLLMPASHFLRKVERFGLRVDTDYLSKLESSLQSKAREEYSKVQMLANRLGWSGEAYAEATKAAKTPVDLNPSSPRQLKWFLYDFLKVVPPRGYNKDTRKETLDKLIEYSKHPQVKEFLQSLRHLRRHKKLLSTYVEGLRKEIHPDGKVHPTYLLHGTVTGRLSSRGPNIQNIPREETIRNIFVPPSGYVFVEADYAQAELRVLAYLSGDERLKEIFREGRDLHTEATIALIGPDFTKEDRVKIKMVNFGVVYGRGASSIAAQFDMPLSEAQKLVDGWAKHYVQAWEYLEEQARRALQGVVLETPFGRRRRFMVARENMHAVQNEARNFAIQSTASDLTLISAMRIARRYAGSPVRVVNLVHDSVLLEVPEEDAEQVAVEVPKMMKETAEQLLRLDFPFEADAKVGTAWGSLKELNPGA